jgi:transposase
LTNARDCPREEVLARSRGRDRIEKLLDTLKNEDGQHRLRSGNDRSVVGRLFVAFLALVLHRELERRMGKAGLLRQMSVVQFIAHMRKIKSVRMASGTRHLLEITKRNRDIMAAVGVPLPE